MKIEIPKEILDEMVREAFAKGPFTREFEAIRDARNRRDRVMLPFLNDRPLPVVEGGPLLSGAVRYQERYYGDGDGSAPIYVPIDA